MTLMKQAAVAFFFLVVLAASAATARAVETGFLNRCVVVDGEEYRYQMELLAGNGPADVQRWRQ